jgi:hypothetical protein
MFASPRTKMKCVFRIITMRAGGMAQAVDHWISMCEEALSSNFSTAKN